MTWWMKYNKLPWFPLLPQADLRSLTYWGHNNSILGSPVNHLEGGGPQLAQSSCSAKPRWETLGLTTHHFHISPATEFEHTSWQPLNVQYCQGVRTMLEQEVHWPGMMQKEEGARTRSFSDFQRTKGQGWITCPFLAFQGTVLIRTGESLLWRDIKFEKSSQHRSKPI